MKSSGTLSIDTPTALSFHCTNSVIMSVAQLNVHDRPCFLSLLIVADGKDPRHYMHGLCSGVLRCNLTLVNLINWPPEDVTAMLID